MRIPRRLTIALELALVCLLLAAAFAQAGDYREPARSGGDDVVMAQSAAPRFLVRGRVKGLYPGIVRQLGLRLTNPNPFRIAVKTVTVKVQSTTPSCPSKTLKVKKFSGTKRLGARRSAKIKVQVRMKPTATDACQGARFRLVYRGKAVRA